MNRILTLVALALLVARCHAQKVVWQYAPPAGHVDVSPAVGDLTGDGRDDVVVGSTAGLVVALNGQGKELWRHDLGDCVCIPPTIADVNGDGAPEVVAVSRRGRVECLSGRTGDMLWTAMLPAPVQWGSTALAAGDLVGDGEQEIVTGTRDGHVVCLRGATGERLWVYRGRFGVVTSPAIADLEGDGQSEVIVGTAKVPLICLSAKGKLLWRRTGGTGGSPIVCRLRRAGAPVILSGIGKAICATSARGKALWSHPMRGEIDSAISAADVDGSGTTRVFAVDLAGHAVCLNADGSMRWEAEVGERVRRSPSIGDVDGDGKLEVLIAGYSDTLSVFDLAGTLKTRLALPGHCNGTPTIAHLGGAGVSVVLPVTGAPLEALRWPGARRDARVLWPSVRYDARMSGEVSVPRKRSLVRLAVDFGGVHAVGGLVRATVSNPVRRVLTVRIESSVAGGEHAAAEVSASSARIVRSLRYTLPRAGSSSATLTCRVQDGKQTVAMRRCSLYVRPLDAEIATVARALADVQRRVPKLRDRRGIEDRACLAGVRLAQLRPRLQGPKPIGEGERAAMRRELADLRDEAVAVRRLSVLAEAASRTGSIVRICAANPWAPFGGLDELAEGRTASPALTVRAFRGETETAALNVFNLSSQPRTFRVTLDGLTGGKATVRAAKVTKLFSVIDVPTERCDTSADALAPIGAACLLEVPAWGARQLWLNVDTRALGAGEWQGAVLLRSVEVTPIELRAPLAVTVWRPKLPVRQVLRNCGWGYVEGSLLKDYPEAAIADQVAHGTNVYVSTFYPSAKFDVDGNLVGGIDFADHDRYVKAHARHGIILFCGYQGALQGPGDQNSAAYGKAYVQWVRAWVKHLAELGVGYDGFALYPVDEPGLSKGLVETYLRMARLAREADPKVLMYADPVAGIKLEELREMAPVIDIWCPNRTGILLDKTNAAKLAYILSTGKPVWTYECADNAKHQSPIGYYRAQAWLAWSKGLCGIGFWTYCTSPDDPWFVPGARYDYMLVYPGDGVVSSKRWEAVRDGCEDYGLLTMLREKQAAGKVTETAAANRVLGEWATEIGTYCGLVDAELLPGPEAATRERREEDRHWARLQGVRAEIARLLDGR